MTHRILSRPNVRPRHRRGRTAFSLPDGFDAVVFDVDGLLVDTEPLWARAESALLVRHGSSLGAEERLESIGRSIDDTVRAYAERLGLAPAGVGALRAELLDDVRTLFAVEARPRPGSLELVAALRGRLPLALASSTDRDIVELALTTAGFDLAWFDASVTGDEVERAKPAPDLYLRACGLLGVPPAAAVAFEDSQPGIEAALSAGLTCIAVPEHPSISGGAHLVLDSLADALAFVEQDRGVRQRAEDHRM